MKTFLKYLAYPFIWVWSMLFANHDQNHTQGMLDSEGNLIVIDYGETTHFQQEEAIDKAILFWNTALGKKVFINSVDLIEKTEFFKTINIIFNPVGGKNKSAFATWSKTAGHIVVDPKYSKKWYIYAHEFGHCLGLQHTKYIKSIMYPWAYPMQKVVSQIKEIISPKLNSFGNYP